MAYDIKHDPNNPDATPVYNDNLLKFWNWFSDVWGCNDWITWHKAMMNKYGRDRANNTFLKHWDNLATGSSAIDCRSFNTAFRDYTKKVGLYDALYSGLGIIAKPIGVTTDVISGAGDVIGGVAKGAGNAGKTLKVILPVILIAIAAMFIMVAYKKSQSLAR